MSKASDLQLHKPMLNLVGTNYNRIIPKKQNAYSSDKPFWNTKTSTVF